jgi:hypothetical protein
MFLSATASSPSLKRQPTCNEKSCLIRSVASLEWGGGVSCIIKFMFLSATASSPPLKRQPTCSNEKSCLIRSVASLEWGGGSCILVSHAVDLKSGLIRGDFIL